MLGWIARWIGKRLATRQLNAFEQAFDYDARYMREMVDTSWTGFMRFLPINKMAAYREDVPLDVWYAAKLTTLITEDCGPCTQLVVNMAEADGVDATVLRGILTADEAAAGPHAWLGVCYARATLARDGRADVLRERIVAQWGEKALLSLALGIAAVRVYPTVKYALGHGKACTRVAVGGVFTKPQAALA